MGGREYQVLTGGHGTPDAGLARDLMAAGAMILPSFSETGGPFPGRCGDIRAGDLSADGRASLASLYLALMTDVCLDLCGSLGPIRLEGPMAGNAVLAGGLAALRRGQSLALSDDAAGTLLGAALLAGVIPPPKTDTAISPLDGPWDAYRQAWRQALG
jgi:sugar (pentulose or hexulose) kinase